MSTRDGYLRIAYVNGRWRADKVEDHRVMNQLREEAGLKHAPWPDDSEAYEKLLIAASHQQLGLQTEFPRTEWDQRNPQEHN